METAEREVTPLAPARLAEIAARADQYALSSAPERILAAEIITVDIPALLAEVARQQAEIARLRAVADVARQFEQHVLDVGWSNMDGAARNRAMEITMDLAAVLRALGE